MAFAGKHRGTATHDQPRRITLVDRERCRPSRCAKECQKICPQERQGVECIRPHDGLARVVESACTGCGMCVRRCPFQALRIVNIPRALAAHLTHRHGRNGFCLHRLPLPCKGRVVGLLGANGVGKTTALHVLSGRTKPNFGDPAATTWERIVEAYRGSALQSYFRAIAEGSLRVAHKPQSIDMLRTAYAGTVAAALEAVEAVDEWRDEAVQCLDLQHLLQREMRDLSGGELQRVSVALTCSQRADVYVFDEPSSFLDIAQRLRAGRLIRAVAGRDHSPYVLLVDHDLCFLDSASDSVCILHGNAGAYGAVSPPSGTREAINQFLVGYIRAENLRFRDSSLSFLFGERDTDPVCTAAKPIEYPALEAVRGGFRLNAEAGTLRPGQVVVLLGENGTGKSTLVDTMRRAMTEQITVSVKPQVINPKFRGSVKQLLDEKLGSQLQVPAFRTDVVAPLQVEALMHKNVQQLSGGELQRVALVLALGKPAQLYLVDEPSAHLDVEMRLVMAKALRRFARHCGVAVAVVEHDLLLAAYMADSAVVFSGEPGVAAVASAPMVAGAGLERFLRGLGITVRRDPDTGRPRINKRGSVRDREQRAAGQYFDAECQRREHHQC
eukprot:TRINITY_DN3307_c0_g1_i1.p1 TRINITY_DN3307_c0_g1~~TRINITY_DN3307_c0_g1_i1.p1  ORF type:complete len:612 (+),score=230.74 TRINITY_DN3307_c0_g1_i1:72-1907(+)